MLWPTFDTPPSLVQAVIAGGKRTVFRSAEGAEDNGLFSALIISTWRSKTTG